MSPGDPRRRAVRSDPRQEANRGCADQPIKVCAKRGTPKGAFKPRAAIRGLASACDGLRRLDLAFLVVDGRKLKTRMLPL
jgi:hypothetical protein